MAKGKKKIQEQTNNVVSENKRKAEHNQNTKNENNYKKAKKHKKFNIKKNIGRLVALIIVISMLLASSATLIFYLMWY